MKLFTQFSILGLVLTMVGCGSSGEGSGASREFSQNVDRVVYDLKTMEVNTEFGTASNSNVEQHRKSIGEAGIARDKIVRLIKGPAFVLVINDKESSLQVSSAGNIDHMQTVSENGPGCQLTGLSKVSGVSTSLKFQLQWEFKATLKGDGCDETMVEKFQKFQNSELEVFHLTAVSSELESAELSRSSQRSVHIIVKAEGESH